MATLPPGFVEAPVAAGIINGTALELAPNGDLWILEQGGAVKRFVPGSTAADIVGNVSTLGLSAIGERGLLGIAFDPDYAANKNVYLYYTATTPSIHNRISRFTVIDTDAADYYFAGTSTADPDAGASGAPTQTIILDLDPLSATNHNGGAIHFGPDGKLYVAVGENAVGSNSQTLSNLLGKILRINSDGSIPPDNPFFDTATGNRRAIWALGLRNPYTFAFQPGTGRMFINDVGQVSWEEINEGLAGANYGWPSVEGDVGTPPAGPGFYQGPLYAYSHGGGTFQGFAITGGAFYNPVVTQFPAEYMGDYFFADFVSSWINVIDPATLEVRRFATSAPNTVDLRVTGDGSLLYLARGVGQVFRVSYPPPLQPPEITVNPADRAVTEGEPVSFMVAAGGTAPLSYQWQMLVGSDWTNVSDDGRIGGTETAMLAIAAARLDDVGEYRVVVTNIAGSAASDPALLAVTPANTPPTISALPDQALTSGEARDVVFTIGDAHTPAGDLVVSVESDNAALLPPGSLTISGSGADRTLRIDPAPYQYATAEVTITVSDGELSASGSFLISVSPPPFPWHNFEDSLDVDRDGHITPTDALLIINYLNAFGDVPLPPPSPGFHPPPYYDVSRDDFIAPDDALLVINYLNALPPRGSTGLALLIAGEELKPKRNRPAIEQWWEVVVD